MYVSPRVIPFTIDVTVYVTKMVDTTNLSGTIENRVMGWCKEYAGFDNNFYKSKIIETVESTLRSGIVRVDMEFINDRSIFGVDIAKSITTGDQAEQTNVIGKIFDHIVSNDIFGDYALPDGTNIRRSMREGFIGIASNNPESYKDSWLRNSLPNMVNTQPFLFAANGRLENAISTALRMDISPYIDEYGNILNRKIVEKIQSTIDMIFLQPSVNVTIKYD